KCELAMGGTRQQGFASTRGIRQGRPLAPLLFAVAPDILLRRIARQVPDRTLRARSDDTALVHPDIWGALPQIEVIPPDFQRMSELALNVDKTAFVPLSRGSSESTRERLARAAPLWGSRSVARNARHLGYAIGPGRGDLTWDAPAWAWGLNTILAHLVFVLSTTPFACQLDPLPEKALEVEAGFGLLKSFKWLGFPAEVPDLDSIAVAARASVALRENMKQGGLRVTQRARQLRQLLSRADCADRALHHGGWIGSNFPFSLVAATLKVHALQDMAPAELNARDECHKKAGWQARVSKALRPPLELEAQAHLRRRRGHWQARAMPGRRVQSFMKHMRRLAGPVAPRVQSATLRAARSTASRFGGRAPCCFGCHRGSDSIKHYAACGEFHALRARWLGLTWPQMACQLDDFIGLGITTARS
ncbi:unnamed protein product, partial [Prorocentrum cordatum]